MTPGYLTDSDGSPSSYRLMMILGVFLILGVWAFVCIYGAVHPPAGATGLVIADIPWNLVTIIGLLLAGKVAQKWKEGPAKGGEVTP